MKSTITVAKLKIIYLCFYILVPLFWLGIYIGIWGVAGAMSLRSLLIGTIIFVIGTPVHELIHYYCFILFNGVDKSNVTIHFDIKNANAYVVCEAATTSRRYRVSAIAPFIFLGLLPAAYGLVFKTTSVGIAGVLSIASCAGDLVLFALLMRIDSTVPVSRYVSRHEGRVTQLGFMSAP
jgi:hypothetical protein